MSAAARLALSQMLQGPITMPNRYGGGRNMNQQEQENQLQQLAAAQGVGGDSFGVWSPIYGRVLYPGSAEFDKVTGKNTVQRAASPTPTASAPGPSGPGPGTTLPRTPGTFDSGLSPDDELKAHRQQLFQNLEQLRGFHAQDPQSQLLGAQLTARSQGSDAPFSQTVQQGLFAQNADAAAAAARANEEMIRSRFANAGLGGSGLQMAAQLDARRRAQKATRQGRTQIRTRAELENFQARERAQQALAQHIDQRALHQRGAVGLDTSARGRLEAVSGGVRAAQAIGQGLAGGQASPRALPQGFQGRALGNPMTSGSSYGGVTNLGVNVGQFRQGPGPRTQYPQMGLGGAAGPFGAISRAHDQADRNMQTSRQTRDVSFDPYRGKSPDQLLGMFGLGTSPAPPPLPGGPGEMGSPMTGPSNPGAPGMGGTFAPTTPAPTGQYWTQDYPGGPEYRVDPATGKRI